MFLANTFKNQLMSQHIQSTDINRDKRKLAS